MTDDDDLSQRAGDTVPNPDPTARTLETVNQRLAALDRFLDLRFGSDAEARTALKETFNVRIEAIEKALAVFQEGITRVPTDVDKRVGGLKELHEKQFGEMFRAIQLQFDGIQTQFKERDTRAEQTSRDSKVAVDAALQAAKEAVGAQNAANNTAIAKSETATTKQIDQLGTLIQTQTGGLNDKIDDLKGRLTAMEGKASGVQTTQTTQQSNNSYTVAVVGLVVGTLIAVGSILINLAR
jgi:hypothetical protein